MSSFTCRRCGYHTKVKCNYKRHLHRKKLCPPTLSDVSIEELRRSFGKPSSNTNELLEIIQAQLREQKQRLDERDKQIERLLKQTANVNVNIQQNNVINNYNDTDISHLTTAHYKKICRSALDCIPKMIEMVHFNKNKKENHNVYIPRLTDEHAMLFRNGKWIARDSDEVVSDLIEDNTIRLMDKMEELKHVLDDYNASYGYKCFMHKKDDDVVTRRVRKNTKYLLYNLRHVLNNI